MARFGLNSNSTTDDFVRVLTQLDADNVALSARVKELEVGEKRKAEERNKKQWAECKAFTSLKTLSTDCTDFGEWEFKLHQFLRPYSGAEEWMEWVKNLESEPTQAGHDAKRDELVDVDLDHYDEQLYSVLSLLCVGTPLQTVRNQRENYGVRGQGAWYKLTREVAGKTGVRLERLADLVHNPKPITSYKDALAMLEKWESQRLELEKLEEQSLSDLTKRTLLKKMLPPDLIRDVERDRSLKTWEEAWKFVLEQVPLRKEWPAGGAARR